MRGALPPGLSQVVDHQGRGDHAAADGRLHRAAARPQPLPLAPRAGARPHLDPSAPLLHRLRTASAPPPHRLRSSSRAQRPSASLRATSSASSRVPTALASTLPRRSSRPRCPAATVRCHLVQLRGRGRGRGKGGPQWHCRARLGTSAPLQTSAAPSAPCHASVCLCRCLATPPYFWPDAASRRGAARTAHLGRGGAAAALPDRRPPPRRRQLVRESAQPDDRPPTTQEPRFPAKDPIVGRGRCYKVVCRSPETWAVLASRERVSECCEGTSARVHMCGPPGGSLTVPRLGATRATPVLYLGYPLSIIIKPYNVKSSLVETREGELVPLFAFRERPGEKLVSGSV